jgi:hypothetical protein
MESPAKLAGPHWMTIDHVSHKLLHRCPMVRHDPQIDARKGPERCEEEIEIANYMSEVEAETAGWKKTSHWRLCDPAEPFVWICPACAAGINWEALD